MKNTKRVLAILLAAVLMLSLTGCSASDYKAAGKLFESGDYAGAIEAFLKIEDYKDSGDYITRAREAIIRASVLGEWKCVYNMDEDFATSFAEGLTESSGLDPADYFSFSDIEALFTLVLNDDDTYTLDVDKEAFAPVLDRVCEELKVGINKMMEDLIASQAAENGLEVDSLLALLGVADVQEFVDSIFETGYGMTMDEMLDQTMAASGELMFKELPMTGTFSVSGTTVTLSDAGDAEYNVVNELLTLFDGLNETFGELVFTR